MPTAPRLTLKNPFILTETECLIFSRTASEASLTISLSLPSARRFFCYVTSGIISENTYHLILVLQFPKLYSRSPQGNQWVGYKKRETPCDMYIIPREFINRTATASTIPESNYIAGWMRKNNSAARAALTLVQCFDVVCQLPIWKWNFEI